MQDFGTLFLFLIILVVLYIIFFIIVVNRRTSKFVKKFHGFALYNQDTKQSILDTLNNILWRIIKAFSSLFSKSTILKMHSESFDKYISYDDEEKINGMDLITFKILFALLFFFLTLILCLYNVFNISYFAIVFLSFVAYFMPNILLNIHFSHKKENVLNDIIDAIMIINSTLSSGETFYKAIELVVSELDGAISDEFKKIHYDLEYGLDIKEAFARFDKRMRLSVTAFISETLSIFDSQDFSLHEIFVYIENAVTTKINLKKEAETTTFGIKLIVKGSVVLPLIASFVLLFNLDIAKKILNNPFGICNVIAIAALIVLYNVIAYKILEVNV